MARSTKDNAKKEKKRTVNKINTITKKSTSNSTTPKTTTKKTTSKKEKAKKEVVASKKSNTSKAPVKKPTNKIDIQTKTTTQKRIVKKEKQTKTAIHPVVEYYDLPYRYNQTIVKILAQTPTVLFVYWDISDQDRQNYVHAYGEHFFEHTKPVLIVHNNTKNSSYEVEINDFANSWYLPISDTNCNYTIELGRRPITQKVPLEHNYLYITSSNPLETPNDHILFDTLSKTIYFRNVKNNIITSKDITSLSFLQHMGRIYNIYDLYKQIYQTEDLSEFDDFLHNPSSGNPTSTFK